MAEEVDDPDLRRALLSYVFVGAGYAGLEGIAELQDFARDVIDRYPRLSIDDTTFMLVEARERVMPEIGPRLAEFATKQLRKRGIDVRLETTLERVEADRVTLAGGEVVPARTVVWTAGVRPVRVVERLGLPIGRGGRIEVDATCRVAGFDDVWAIGDAAGVPDAARPGELCPPTAQHALRQGRLVGANVARVCAGGTPKPFTFKTLGVFVDMGRYKAVAETGPLRWRGFPAWFLARTYHLLLMPGIKRRVRLVTDWTVGLLFGRDASDLGRLGHPGRLEVESEPGGDERVGGTAVALDDRASAPGTFVAGAAARRGPRAPTGPSLPSHTRSSGKRIVNVCTLRHFGMCSAYSGGIESSRARPFMRAERVFASATRRPPARSRPGRASRRSDGIAASCQLRMPSVSHSAASPASAGSSSRASCSTRAHQSSDRTCPRSARRAAAATSRWGSRTSEPSGSTCPSSGSSSISRAASQRSSASGESASSSAAATPPAAAISPSSGVRSISSWVSKRSSRSARRSRVTPWVPSTRR